MAQLAGLSERKLKAMNYPKPVSRFCAWVSPTAADQAEQETLRMGSDMLLKRLWECHPRILNHLSQAGNQVVRP